LRQLREERTILDLRLRSRNALDLDPEETRSLLANHRAAVQRIRSQIDEAAMRIASSVETEMIQPPPAFSDTTHVLPQNPAA